MQKAEPVLLPQRRVTNMAIEIIMDWLQATLRWAAPLLIVAIGEVYAERSGVINMGIEGIMLFGALTGIAAGF